MNAFEKFDADRALRRQNLIVAWSQFRATVNALVATFNKMEEGLANPAKLDDSPDLVTITCKRESSSGSGMLNIVAKMTLTETRQVAILAWIEFWSLATTPPLSQGTENFEFLVEPDPEIRLSFDEKQFTPVEAADTVMMKALLGLPARSNIAVVNKRNRDAA